MKFAKINGVEATDENISNKSYPLTKVVYAIMRKDEPKDSNARKLVDWLLTNEDNPLGWENVSLQIYKNGTLAFAYTYGDTTYTGTTTVENCTVSTNTIVVNTWTEGNMTQSTTFYFINSGSCMVNEECVLRH